MALEFKDMLKLAKAVAKADPKTPTAYTFGETTYSYEEMNEALIEMEELWNKNKDALYGREAYEEVNHVLELAKALLHSGKNGKATAMQDFLEDRKTQPTKANTTGRIAIVKDGTKKLVSVDEARDKVSNDGWSLAAASCWKKASPQALQLGKELGLLND